MKHYIKFIANAKWCWPFVACITLLSTIFSSCKKFVAVPPPNSILTQPVVFNSDATATAAIDGLYISIFNNTESYNMSMYSGIEADELTNYCSDISFGCVYFYQNNLFSGDVNSNVANSDVVWINFYNYIYQADAIIDGLATVAGTSAAAKKQLTGEAKFMRAFCYFYLVNCYGDVPPVTTIDYRANSLIRRSPASDIYAQMIADLQDARALLNINYIDATDTATTADRVRPNRAAATALLARAYLYNGKYDSAALMASEVIADNRYSLPTDLTQVFLAAGSVPASEAIWQLMTPSPLPYAAPTSDGDGFVLLTGPADYQALRCTAISPQLLASFEPGDLRKTVWIDSVIVENPIATYYFPYKYQIGHDLANPNNRTEYTMVLRLAEQYLIRAEARAQIGDNDGSIADLNMIRQRAGLAPYSGASEKDALLTAILHERQVELFTEWGHRWFDLIRTNSVDIVMGAPGNVTQQKGGAWDHHQVLRPIPFSEIQSNSYLTQNPGY